MASSTAVTLRWKSAPAENSPSFALIIHLYDRLFENRHSAARRRSIAHDLLHDLTRSDLTAMTALGFGKLDSVVLPWSPSK
ncbi:hypothetical protein BH11VER1_BH11VER1_24100 [soil metagenome]